MANGVPSVSQSKLEMPETNTRGSSHVQCLCQGMVNVHSVCPGSVPCLSAWHPRWHSGGSGWWLWGDPVPAGPGVPFCVWMPVVGAGEPLVTGHGSVSLCWACRPALRGSGVDEQKRGLWLETADTRTPSSWWLRELSGCWGVGLGKAPRENLTPQRAVSQRRMWKDPAELGLLSNICETLEEAWVLTTLPSGELGCMVGLPLPRIQQIGVPLPGNRMPPSGLAFSPRQLQGYGKVPLAHTRCPGLSTPRLKIPPPSGDGRCSGSLPRAAAELEHRRLLSRLPPPPSLPPCLCSSLLPLQGDVGLTGHLPWARDGGGDARQELAC